MRLAIVGTRDFCTDRHRDELLVTFWRYVRDNKVKLDILTIVSGGARGADTLAESLADELAGCGVKKNILRPDWQLHGKGAGMIRNKKIIDNCDFLMAFWDGISRGTENTIALCTKAKRSHLVVRYDTAQDSSDPPHMTLNIYSAEFETLWGQYR